MVLAGLAVVRADELRFAGGDVVVGNYVGTEEGVIVFDSPVFGRITVAESDVKLVRTGAPVQMPMRPIAAVAPVPEAASGVEAAPAQAVEPPVEVAPLAGGPPPMPTSPSSVDAVAAAVDEVASNEAAAKSLGYRILSLINPFKGWSSKLSFGYAWEKTAARTEDLTLGFEADRKGDGSEFKFSARYEYGTAMTEGGPEERVRDRVLSNFRYREDLGKRLFFQADANYQKDRIKEIEHELRQNAGVGYRVFIGDPLSASIVPKLTLRYRELETGSEGWDFLVTVSQDLRYAINERMTFIESAWLSWNPDDFRRSQYGVTLRLENRLTDRIFVDLAYENEFDYEVRVGLQPKRQRTLVLVGYKF